MGFLFKRNSYSLKMFPLVQIDISPLDSKRDNLLPYNQELQHVTKVPGQFFSISSIWLIKRWEMNNKIFCKRKDKQSNTRMQYGTLLPQIRKESESHRNSLGQYSPFYTLCVLWKTPRILLFLHKHHMAKKISLSLFSWPTAVISGNRTVIW